MIPFLGKNMVTKITKCKQCKQCKNAKTMKASVNSFDLYWKTTPNEMRSKIAAAERDPRQSPLPKLKTYETPVPSGALQELHRKNLREAKNEID